MEPERITLAAALIRLLEREGGRQISDTDVRAGLGENRPVYRVTSADGTVYLEFASLPDNKHLGTVCAAARGNGYAEVVHVAGRPSSTTGRANRFVSQTVFERSADRFVIS